MIARLRLANETHGEAKTELGQEPQVVVVGNLPDLPKNCWWQT